MKTKPRRKKHNASFKAKVAMEAMLGIKTVSQIAKEYGVHPVQVSRKRLFFRPSVAPRNFDCDLEVSADRRTTPPEPRLCTGTTSIAVAVDTGRVELGRLLFHDKRLSGDETLSCASCHSVDHWGADGLSLPSGIRGQKGPVNTPTVFNAVFNQSQFWDGRSRTLEAQALLPVENPLEMGANWTQVVRRIAADPDYRDRFTKVFPRQSITRQKITEAIAAFESTLVTPNARFDHWLKGKDTALKPQELEGYRLFKQIGCISCHQGMNVGGNVYQTMGKFGDYFQERGGEITRADLGRFNVTGVERDRHKFKVPSLRNVEKTAPYFHDGSAKTLEQAIKTMARYQLGRRLEPSEVRLLADFLKSLTGEPPRHATH